MSISMSTAVCFIACHGGPADHFATYAKEMSNQGYGVQIHATGPALKKFEEHGVEVNFPFSLEKLTREEEDELARKIAKICSTSSIIITDLGHVFDVKIQKALMIDAAKVCRFAYYDNPEPFVPGGYSSTAAKVIELANGVLFANETLKDTKIFSSVGNKMDLSQKKLFGVGYYPVDQAEKILKERKLNHKTARSTFLKENEIEDNGQKVLVYCGGNNDEYFLKAFPAFLSFVADSAEEINLKNIVIVIQQHPGAKVKNQDGQQVEEWLKKFEEQSNIPKVILSKCSSNEAQVLADAILYHQTSMGPQFILAEIPTVQIGHEIYEDILVRNDLVLTVTNPKQFTQVVGNLENTVEEEPQKNLVLSSLGIREDWFKVLDQVIKESVLSKNSVEE